MTIIKTDSKEVLESKINNFRSNSSSQLGINQVPKTETKNTNKTPRNTSNPSFAATA
mgnify:CR=1 FL=1|tara:strand:- start:422 stop:592 length:171 start_codon:yes stop_codon:yes gene_type:complete